MTTLRLRRIEQDDHATLGDLFFGDKLIAYTLENRAPKVAGIKEPGKSRIPAGTYSLGLRQEGGFYNRYTKRWDWHGPMVEILLPGWQYVLIHCGNYHTDTDGCILVGESYGDSDRGLAVWKSRTAYRDIYPSLLEHARHGGTITIEDEA